MKVHILSKNLTATVREFNYFLEFIGINKKINEEEVKEIIDTSFYSYNRIYRMIQLISIYFHDPLFVSFVYLKVYLKKQDYEIKQILKINSEKLNELRKKYFKKDYRIIFKG